uniref:STAS domain-containing protein n=1 Tax=Phaeomonas parva TaxID=124430 RepID=A0A7S1TMZ3_9STRA|mmetsp:Transcript_10011/g.29519  ORF Transcript_10011/g.29519 Transcript_10011/m.29519 type:complete len:894 (+) Transcript_10011:2138-4819(+)
MGIIGYIIRLFGLMGLQRRWGGDGGDGDGGGDGGGDGEAEALLGDEARPAAPSQRELSPKDPKWGATPRLRHQYSRDAGDILLNASEAARRKSKTMPTLPPSPLLGKAYGSMEAAAGAGDEEAAARLKDDFTASGARRRRGEPQPRHWIVEEVQKLPGLLIGTVLNLMLCVPFASSFFPLDWEPFPVNRMVGVQMWLFSTAVCQLVMTLMSDFPVAMGMMMVENIPFMHSLAETAMAELGTGHDALATVVVTFALSSVVVGVAFLALGYFKLGNATYFFPRHVIVGCIGGIGLFVTQTGLEVATKKKWEWDTAVIAEFGTAAYAPLWALPLALEVLLRVLLRVTRWKLLPPFFFVAIPPLFYAALALLRVPVAEARAAGYFFDRAPHADVTLMWQILDFKKVDWFVVSECWPTIIALTIFSLMHAPINIPSLSISTHTDVDMNKELIAHGVSNLAVGFAGGLQNYLCYSNSLLYARCGGGGRFMGFVLTGLLVLFFFIGPDAVSYVPRAMAGCLLIHVGLDLTAEALVDSIGQYDSYEYGSIVLITLVMTTRGMTAGLGLGVLCGTLTFTLQQARFAQAVRGVMTAATLKSSKWRSPRETAVLHEANRQTLVVQLQGNIFFGNSSQITEELSKQLSRAAGSVRYVVLDFTIVTAIDSSATETITKVAQLCHSYGVCVCFCRGSGEGFPCAAPLSERLREFEDDEEDESSWLHIEDDLDSALAWCEDGLLRKYSTQHGLEGAIKQDLPLEFRQIQAILSDVPMPKIAVLLSYFKGRDIRAGETLWVQGSVPDGCGILLKGHLVSRLEEEAGTTEGVFPGAMVGEFGLVNNRLRGSTLESSQDGKMLWLSKDDYTVMRKKQGESALLLSRICIGYLERRVTHVSNRIWESRCLPI